MLALEWDNFVLKEKLKSLMYVGSQMRGYPKKYKLIDELRFKNCMRLKRKTTSKFFLVLNTKKRKFIIHT